MSGQSDYYFQNKWTPEVAIHNFTQVPNLMLRCQGHLGLTDGEFVILIALMSFWFRDTSKIYPTLATLAKFSGKSSDTIQKRLTKLEKKGFIRKNHRYSSSNIYDLTPSIYRLVQHSFVCKRIHEEMQKGSVIVTTSPPAIITNKEDEALRIPKPKNTSSNPFLLEGPNWDEIFPTNGNDFYVP